MVLFQHVCCSKGFLLMLVLMILAIKPCTSVWEVLLGSDDAGW